MSFLSETKQDGITNYRDTHRGESRSTSSSRPAKLQHYLDSSSVTLLPTTDQQLAFQSFEEPQSPYTDEAHKAAAAIAFPVEEDDVFGDQHSRVTPWIEPSNILPPHLGMATASIVSMTSVRLVPRAIEDGCKHELVEDLRPFEHPAQSADDIPTSPALAPPITIGQDDTCHFWCPNNCSGDYNGPHRCLLDGESLKIWCRGSKGCAQTFDTKDKFNQHCNTSHPSTNRAAKGPLHCNIAGCPRGKKPFMRRDNLIQHLRGVHEQKIPKGKSRRWSARYQLEEGTDASESESQR